MCSFFQTSVASVQLFDGEAEFGCPPLPDPEWNAYLAPCENHLDMQTSVPRTNTAVMFVSTSELEESLSDKDEALIQTDNSVLYQSRL